MLKSNHAQISLQFLQSALVFESMGEAFPLDFYFQNHFCYAWKVYDVCHVLPYKHKHHSSSHVTSLLTVKGDADAISFTVLYELTRGIQTIRMPTSQLHAAVDECRSLQEKCQWGWYNRQPPSWQIMPCWWKDSLQQLLIACGVEATYFSSLSMTGTDLDCLLRTGSPKLLVWCNFILITIFIIPGCTSIEWVP